jgi:hypothetical protein
MSGRRPPRTIMLSAGLVLGLSVIAAASLLGGSSHPPTSVDVLRQGLGDPTEPCGGVATASSLSAVTASVPYAVLVPKDRLAGIPSMTHVWSCGGPEVEMQFSSGINVYLDVNGIPDPAAAWAAMAAADSFNTSVGTVRGHPAALIDPAKDPTGYANGSVSFVEGNTWIVIEGNGRIPILALERVAESLTPAGTANPPSPSPSVVTTTPTSTPPSPSASTALAAGTGPTG